VRRAAPTARPNTRTFFSIDTPMAAGLFEQPEVLKYYLERIALGRVGKPSEIA